MSESLKAAAAVVETLLTMPDEELLALLEEAETTLTYAINPEAFAPGGPPAMKEEPKKCEHVPGKFLGHCFSKYSERYSCCKCGEEITVKINGGGW